MRTVHEWLMWYTEPLLVLESGNPNSAYVGNYSQSQAEEFNANYNIQLMTGTSDVDRYQHIRGYRNNYEWLPQGSQNPTVRGFCNGPTPIEGRSPTMLFAPGIADGWTWRSEVRQDGKPLVWANTLWRNVHFVFKKDSDYDGVSTKTFIPSDIGLSANSTYDMEYDATQPLVCPYEQIPIEVTLPHYYKAGFPSSWLVEGVSAGSDSDMITIDVEPTTGLSLRGVLKLQLNMKMQQRWISRATTSTNITLIPTYIQEEHKEASDNHVSKINQANSMIQKSRTLLISSTVIGSVMVALSGVLLMILAFWKKTFVFKRSDAYENVEDAEGKHNEDDIEKEEIAKGNDFDDEDENSPLMKSINQ